MAKSTWQLTVVEAATTRDRFQMHGSRAVMADGLLSDAFEQQIHAIETALESVPDFAFDLSKTLVESVCKTVLADIGQPADSNSDAPRLLKETTSRLTLLPRGHPDPARARSSIERTIRGLLQTIQGLCELRNNYGMASHGRDHLAARLDLRQATLAAQSADIIASFLYRVHRDALMRSPGERVYYEDHTDFNDVFDQKNDVIRLGELEFQPSYVLFRTDQQVYKAALNEYIAENEQAIPDEAPAQSNG